MYINLEKRSSFSHKEETKLHVPCVAFLSLRFLVTNTFLQYFVLKNELPRMKTYQPPICAKHNDEDV